MRNKIAIEQKKELAAAQKAKQAEEAQKRKDAVHLLTSAVDMPNFPKGSARKVLIQHMAPHWIYPEDKTIPPYINEATVGRIAIFDFGIYRDSRLNFYKVFKSMEEAKKHFEPNPVFL